MFAVKIAERVNPNGTVATSVDGFEEMQPSSCGKTTILATTLATPATATGCGCKLMQQLDATL